MTTAFFTFSIFPFSVILFHEKQHMKLMSNQQSNVRLTLIVLLLAHRAHTSEPVAAAWQKRAYPLSWHSINYFALWVAAFGSDAQTWHKPTVGKPQACGDIWIILSDILTSQHVSLFVTCRLHSPSVKKPNCAPVFPRYYCNYRLFEWCYLLQINMFSVNNTTLLTTLSFSGRTIRQMTQWH